MKNIKTFTQSQLSKNQMNEVKGGVVVSCIWTTAGIKSYAFSVALSSVAPLASMIFGPLAVVHVM